VAECQKEVAEFKIAFRYFYHLNLETSAVGNCSPARHARFRQPAIAGWRNENSKNGWQDLAKAKIGGDDENSNSGIIL